MSRSVGVGWWVLKFLNQKKKKKKGELGEGRGENKVPKKKTEKGLRKGKEKKSTLDGTGIGKRILSVHHPSTLVHWWVLVHSGRDSLFPGSGSPGTSDWTWCSTDHAGRGALWCHDRVDVAAVYFNLSQGLASGKVHNSQVLHLCMKEDLPSRLHYSGSERTQPIIGMVEEAYKVADKWGRHNAGVHMDIIWLTFLCELSSLVLDLNLPGVARYLRLRISSFMKWWRLFWDWKQYPTMELPPLQSHFSFLCNRYFSSFFLMLLMWLNSLAFFLLELYVGLILRWGSMGWVVWVEPASCGNSCCF